MPPGNRFRHQTYRSERPTAPYHLFPAARPTEPSSREFDAALAAAGAAFGRARVAAVYCVHGTFAGNDALGLLTELARFAPGLSEVLSRVGKRTVDLIADEAGNYTPEYVAAFQAGLSAGAGRTIPVRLFNWSSQNNHIGRADGAVRLIDELARLAADMPAAELHAAQPPRVVLWGHSHGGNVIALLTNLLGAEAAERDEFFHAARTFYRPWLWREVDVPVWESVRRLLDEADHPLRKLALDIVTFGVPVRYGWDSGGYANLLHFIHHRPPPQGIEHQAPVPIETRRLLGATDGDYVQQIGIAGSNLAPNPLAVGQVSGAGRASGAVAQATETRNPCPRRGHDAVGRLRRYRKRRPPPHDRPRGVYSPQVAAIALSRSGGEILWGDSLTHRVAEKGDS